MSADKYPSIFSRQMEATVHVLTVLTGLSCILPDFILSIISAMALASGSFGPYKKENFE